MPRDRIPHSTLAFSRDRHCTHGEPHGYPQDHCFWFDYCCQCSNKGSDQGEYCSRSESTEAQACKVHRTKRLIRLSGSQGANPWASITHSGDGYRTQQEIPVANVEVYVVIGGTITDDYNGCSESWIVSVHKTREAAIAVCQANEIAQLQKQLDAVRELPGHSPKLHHHWYVSNHALES
jgi:hypothetical protein